MSFLPDGAERVTVCTETAHRELSPNEVAQLQDLLRAIKAEPSTNGCTGTPQSPVSLSASYPRGRPSILRFTPGCEPSVDNGFLAGQPSADQEHALKQLLDPSGG
jgi:hypothetical protein